MAAIGRVLLMDKGAYSGSTVYNQLDWVRDNGAAWVCKVDGTEGIAPPTLPTTSNANWTLMAADGSVSGTIDWTSVNNKPFKTIGTGLQVDALERLNVDSSLLMGSLGDLSDVTLTTPTSDQVLKYNGSAWVNATVPSGGLPINLFDTETSLDGETVTFNGIDITKSYLLQADLPNNYDGAPVSMTNIELTYSGGQYSVTYTVTNASVNQSFDLIEMG